MSRISKYYQAGEEGKCYAGDKLLGGDQEEVIKRIKTKADRDDIVHIACIIQVIYINIIQYDEITEDSEENGEDNGDEADDPPKTAGGVDVIF